jgi:hypothetical protein
MNSDVGAPISATELAEMEVDAARGDLKAFDSIRLLAEVRRLRKLHDDHCALPYPHLCDDERVD